MKRIICFALLGMAINGVYSQQQLIMEDSRGIASTPVHYNFKLKPSFKYNTDIGLNVSGNYSTVLGMRGWWDDSGGKAHELAFTDNDLYIRSGYDSGWEAWRKMVTADANGYVGIGTSNPQTFLTLKNQTNDKDYISIIRTDDSPNMDIFSSYSGSDDIQSGYFAYGVRPVDDAWQIWNKTTGISWVNLVSVKANGNVGIGTATPQDKLAVNGNIRAREIKVETTNWPDYVFEEEYKLTPLAEVETFIKANKHLPDVPSAKEIEEEGLSVGEMNKLMMKKIEELTLHLIEKEKTQKLYEQQLADMAERLKKIEEKQ
ncbi:hypothetical protein ACFU8T_13350 [Sphingobacterium spiritivorum]|uniref:Uncharacterized protein n=1 Tax=Sphingobacterium spiritivorum ATCC 33861 TaxID=525373 RepID=D7VJX2_SPHSI|nr:hypothetical protein [Sphingobacterium spiritivorum]EFK58574.1 hypothetical protein HMPREF0766_11291 [Sphingobacterium spiritivorum ATCC 33861]QQT34520.1 hypothetical protein I6J01_14490 [Sphingobacterium spiritivorum]WQD35379.1 hypothetical protein U0038_06425 [Sphingobacterium spiritivorum]SUJ00233.1 Uncharacterised protein [Sphingobacterium spiritivorum]